ncbi:hypothetical protein [Streptomyces rishiriensis]|uniref:hypothetical protein n=1 Tax=Streptomyces rishiriensis TaxID=68264 RepID=UPI0037CCE6FD
MHLREQLPGTPVSFLQRQRAHRPLRRLGRRRIRFAVEVASAVADQIGAGRTGVRLSPGNPYNDIHEDDTHELYPALVRALAPLDQPR